MKIWIVLIVAGVLTFLMRYLPMNSPFFHRMSFFKHPAFAILPLCLLAALIGPNFLPWEHAPTTLSTSLLFGAISTVVATHLSSSIIGGALAGYLSFIILNLYLN